MSGEVVFESKDESLLLTSALVTGEREKVEEGELQMNFVTSSPVLRILFARSGPILTKNC